MKAYIQRAPIGDDGRPVPIPKGNAIGVRSRYLTRDGVTFFVLEGELSIADSFPEDALPGMVGVSRRGDVYIVDDDGHAQQLTTRLIGVHDYERVLSVERADG